MNNYQRNNRRRRQPNRRAHTTIRARHQKVVRRKLNKKKVVGAIVIFLLLIISIVRTFNHDETIETSSEQDSTPISSINEETLVTHPIEEQTTKKEITDWRLTLANSENILPEDFEPELDDIDETKQFDARAIKYLKKMINDMWEEGIKNVWVQSAYRSVERQKELYDNSIQKYIKQGKTQEEAQRLTEEYINKPGASDHNLGLAVDFNNVDNNFEDLKAFKWLKENAEDYGFILRYPKDKEDITKISYESWHWRFVGEEHAKKMNELNMCLEEYIDYLKKEGQSLKLQE